MAYSSTGTCRLRAFGCSLGLKRVGVDFLARAAADRHLARHLHNLKPEELADLAARQRAILDASPSFDPSELDDARRALDAAGRVLPMARAHERPSAAERRDRLARRLTLVEARHDAHGQWRAAADDAAQLLRRIAMVEPDQRHHARALRR